MPVERVTFHNPENGSCVLRTRPRGHRELVTAVGHAATVAPGEWITASGDWVNDRTHVQQFRARFIRTAAPNHGPTDRAQLTLKLDYPVGASQQPDPTRDSARFTPRIP